MTSSQQRRRRRIRRTVGAASLATFAVAWGVIAGTGAMGHSSPAATAAHTAQQTAQPSGDWSWSADDDQGVPQQAPAMTTRQS